MKTLKLLSITASIITWSAVNLIAQTTERTTAWNYLKEGQLAKAKESIDRAAANELTIVDAKTWSFRARIYLGICLSPDPAVTSLSKDPLSESYESLIKSFKLDTKNKLIDDNVELGADICATLYNAGVENYNNAAMGMLCASSTPKPEVAVGMKEEEVICCLGFPVKKTATVENKITKVQLFYPNNVIINTEDGVVKTIQTENAEYLKTPTPTFDYKKEFSEALNRFEQFINTIKSMGKDSNYVKNKYQIDTKNVYFYAAVCANQIGETQKAKSLLEGLVVSRYTVSSVYTTLADIYLGEGNIDKALSIIETGKKYIIDKEGSKNITLKELYIYQQSGRINELKEKLEKALREDPENPNLLLTLGETNYNIYAQLEEENAKNYPENNLKRNLSREEVIKLYGEPTKSTKTGSGKYVKEILEFQFGQVVLENSKVVEWTFKPERVSSYESKKAEANEFLDKSIEIFLGSINKIKEEELELKFLVYQKIGTIYYNIGVDYYNSWADERDETKAEALKKLYTDNFDLALPYLEKSREMNPNDKASIPLLKKIYLLKNDMEKFQEINKISE